LLAAVIWAFGAQPLFQTAQALGIAVVASTLLIFCMLRIWPTNAFFRRLTLTDAQDAGYVASADHRAWIGRTGYAASTLRPGGVAEIAGERLDVLTEGDFVEEGTPIRITRVEGRRIFVTSLADEKR
jgi:membrane-bound serine protease (ClpP class)